MAILVGVDGSPGSRHALAWAISEAALREVTVDAVISWQAPPYAYPGAAVLPPVAELAESAAAALEETVAQTVGGHEAGQRVTVNQDVVEGPAAAVLIERSGEAELLVVGSRGYGGFRGLLLGSVSQQCASHASCPVVVVPTPDE